MQALVIAALVVSPAQPPAPTKHEDQNPLYKNLLEAGLPAGKDAKAKFPAPSMPDGLAAAKQTEVIKALIAGEYDYDNFTRDSVVAPRLLKIRDLPGGDPKEPLRAVDLWFVVHGDFKKLEDDKFLDRLMNSNKGMGKSVELAPADLKKRGIELAKGKEKTESYGFVEFDFLEKVKLKATGHAMWTRNGESIVVAAEIDPRFLNDKEFPNQWSSITKEGGVVKAGPANAWKGAALYLKVTKLQAPGGTMLIEQHIIFIEPTGWFDGANLLRSKLPFAVQDSVSNMRKEFKKEVRP